ncbi:MAG: hypothetical protein B7Z08_06490 [Sphingomonadales bacterium 32-68-7]|nr:MAG: hypothetical protein B7Z33_12340 [Sphingomonadales bacterium 12-68-11]OYX09173.1 MAG: hypothetical protein B7Z08_06490 [Sphingomonadales bacterium 32-68-7]
MACAAATASAQTPSAGTIGTLPRGSYLCELPGDAAGAIGQPQPEAGFAILSASRYASPQGEGTYLRRGDTLTMTSGPRQGDSYTIRGEGFLRKLEGGQPGRLRCVLKGRR